MNISIDTKEDSHEEIKQVIKMLQNLIGDSQEILINQPQEGTVSHIANIFGDISAQPQVTSETKHETQMEETEKEETPESTGDLFAELFSEEDLKKMNDAEIKKDENEEEIRSKGKKYNVELY